MSRQVMALINDHMAVLSDAVIYYAFPDETLNDADVNLSGRSISSSADSSDRFRRDIKESRESLNPFDRATGADELARACSRRAGR